MHQILKKTTIIFSTLLAVVTCGFAQELHSRWDELTASEWPKALEMSGARHAFCPLEFLRNMGPMCRWASI